MDNEFRHLYKAILSDDVANLHTHNQWRNWWDIILLSASCGSVGCLDLLIKNCPHSLSFEDWIVIWSFCLSGRVNNKEMVDVMFRARGTWTLDEIKCVLNNFMPIDNNFSIQIYLWFFNSGNHIKKIYSSSEWESQWFNFIRMNNVDILKLIAGFGEFDKDKSIQIAIEHNSLDVIKYFLEIGIIEPKKFIGNIFNKIRYSGFVQSWGLIVQNARSPNGLAI